MFGHIVKNVEIVKRRISEKFKLQTMEELHAEADVLLKKLEECRKTVGEIYCAKTILRLDGFSEAGKYLSSLTFLSSPLGEMEELMRRASSIIQGCLGGSTEVYERIIEILKQANSKLARLDVVPSLTPLKILDSIAKYESPSRWTPIEEGSELGGLVNAAIEQAKLVMKCLEDERKQEEFCLLRGEKDSSGHDLVSILVRGGGDIDTKTIEYVAKSLREDLSLDEAVEAILMKAKNASGLEFFKRMIASVIYYPDSAPENLSRTFFQYWGWDDPKRLRVDTIVAQLDSRL